jgi:hypothetical protein
MSQGIDESLEGLAWLIAEIRATPSAMSVLTGGVWPLQAPEGAALPYAVVTPMGGHDVPGVAGYRLMSEIPYQVRLWGFATQSDSLKTAANAVDAVLQPNGRASQGTTALAQINYLVPS